MNKICVLPCMDLPKKRQEPAPQTFEAGFKKLEALVLEFERGNLDLETGLIKFKEALKIAEECKKRLDEVENKVVAIKKQFADFNGTAVK